MHIRKNLIFCFIVYVVSGKAQCPPELSVSVLTQTLTCNTPTVLAIASSTTTNTSISWTVPSVPPIVNQPTVIMAPVNTMQFPPPSFYNYTVTVTNTVSSCSTTSVITIYQNFKPPVSLPAVSLPGYICDKSVLLTLGNSTVTSGQPGAFVQSEWWEGPWPQLPLAGSATYSAFTAGVYSLTVKDSYNGCLKTGTVNVVSNQPYFSLSGTAPSNSVACNGSVIITPTVGSGYSVSVNMGTITGTPQNTITNLCYGKLLVCLTYTNTGCKKCDSLTIDGFTVIKNIYPDDDFVVYPNPTSSGFYIRGNLYQSGTIKILNVEGKEIENLIFENGMEIKQLNAGIYFVEIKIENSIVRKKIIVLN